MKILSMLGWIIKDKIESWFQKIIDFIVGFFAFIPQTLYFIYTCAASFLDLLQYLIRKVAGLDTYYIEGQEQTGDIVVSFVRGILGIDKSSTYSALSTVFWSLVIFGVILLVLMTIFAIIKAHYNSDYKKTNPMTIIGSSIKSLALMAIVPLVTVFGLYFCNVMLQALDQATSYNSTGISVFESEAINKLESGSEKGREDQKVYSSYDFFGTAAWTSSTTFSGALFKVAANNCSRVRTGSFSVAKDEDWSENWTNFGIFYSKISDEGSAREAVAQQIDYAFACDLTLKDQDQNATLDGDDSWSLGSSLANGYSAICALGLINVKNFSKYNVGLVWYYYNLWGFNFFLGVAGIIVFLTVLGNIVFGLITRMIELLALFFVFPPLIGLAPLDGGAAFNKWKQKYISDVLMAFGTILGINLFFLILPFLNNIEFFQSGLLNGIMDCVIMLAGLVMVKGLIATLSGFVGAADANKVGEDTRKAVGELGTKALGTTFKGAAVGAKIMAPGVKLGVAGAKFVGNGIGKAGGAIGNKIKTVYNNSASVQNRKKAKGILNDDSLTNTEREQQLKQMYNGKKSQNMVERQQKKKDRKQFREDVKDAWMQTAAYDKLSTAGGAIKTAGKWLGRGTIAVTSTMFGGEVVKDEDGNIDAKSTVGNTIKSFGQAVLDVSKLGIGEILGGDKLVKKFKSKDTGMMDSMRSMVETFGGNKINNSKFMESEASKAKADKAKEDSSATAHAQALENIASNQAAQLKAINDLITKLP